jgi:hypothetical protein
MLTWKDIRYEYFKNTLRNISEAKTGSEQIDKMNKDGIWKI